MRKRFAFIIIAPVAAIAAFWLWLFGYFAIFDHPPFYTAIRPNPLHFNTLSQREVESDAASNSILRAIEDAERHMQLSALPRVQAANDHTVDDGLRKTPKQPY